MQLTSVESPVSTLVILASAILFARKIHCIRSGSYSVIYLSVYIDIAVFYTRMTTVKCIVIHVHTVCIYIYVSKISTDIFA